MLLCFFDRKADIINKIKTFKKMPRLSRTKEENEILDQQLRETVEQHLQQHGKTISWKMICQKLYKKYSIMLNNKQCAQRFKNYSSKVSQPSQILTSEQKEEIFIRHCKGENAYKIKKEMSLQALRQNSFKNILKMQKERIGRILKKVLSENFSKVEFDSNIFLPKDQFRVIIIMFSTGPLLHYYMKKDIKILEFKDKVIEFDILACQVSKKAFSQSFIKGEMSQKLQKMETLKVSILKELQTIFDVYEEVYNNPSLSKDLIGIRELKNHKEKYIYAEAIILGKPVKVCRDQQAYSFYNECQQYQKSKEEIKRRGFFQQMFGNSNFFEEQIIDCHFSKEFPGFSASSIKPTCTLTIDEEKSLSKNLFMQEESDNYLNRYLV